MSKNKYKILNMDPYLRSYRADIELRMRHYAQAQAALLGHAPPQEPEDLLESDPWQLSFANYKRSAAHHQPSDQDLSEARLVDFANGHHFFGFHETPEGWYYREWAPHAESAVLKGDFNEWNAASHPMTQLDHGNWEVFVPGEKLPHGSHVKIQITAHGQTFERVPLYCKRAVQDPDTGIFCGQIWRQDFTWTDQHFIPPSPLLVYECHIGMAGEDYKVHTYREFIDTVLPRVRSMGYNTIQLMAIMEHPYYASFGYQVSNFFAASSRFGTPEDLKALVDAAHAMEITVLLDVVHSHAAKNTEDGIGAFDGTEYQFFHAGGRGTHSAWDTKLFDYGKPEVLHFLLSNLKFWMEEYHFDGFRFDGVTSMLYKHNGLGVAFDSYDKYFSMDTDLDAVAYLQLANTLVHELNPHAITIAEDMSGMPGMCIPIEDGGIGFDYRLSMGIPDFWIGTLKTTSDEHWEMGKLWHELTTRRPYEKNMGYSESHDQALVGDKTIIFWLADAEMYTHMSLHTPSHIIDRALALHKLIRLITFALAGEGYMNFMGNEFGHPEWIDFPRAGNNNSFHYARRQWSLADNPDLKYKYLLAFDRAMLDLQRNQGTHLMGLVHPPQLLSIHQDDKTVHFQKGSYFFAFNFHPERTWEFEHQTHEKAGDTPKLCPILCMDTDHANFGGFGPRSCFNYDPSTQKLALQLAPRTALVYTLSGSLSGDIKC
ncbi:MAG: alpha-amylase family glycosyl hydrolase [Peptococcaceae bacterium]|nr:alpha-amylase family glycosyl hydrolase [Peptococcaceae bacterium]